VNSSLKTLFSSRGYRQNKERCYRAGVNGLEIVAASLGLVNIVLVVRRSVWNFPFGLAMVTIYAWIFSRPDVRLYSDALLQIFFLAVQLYGWWNWSRSESDTGEVRVERLAPAQRLAWIAGITVATAGWGALMYRYTDASLPWWDAFIAMASVAAQLLMARRFVENWMLWIAVDLVAIGVYAAKELMLTAILYSVFLVISAVGLASWRRALGSPAKALAA
jgi:nicotinamide mononucleotide transporter